MRYLNSSNANSTRPIRTPAGLPTINPGTSPATAPPASKVVLFKNARREQGDFFMVSEAGIAATGRVVSFSLPACLFSPSDFRFPP